MNSTTTGPGPSADLSASGSLLSLSPEERGIVVFHFWPYMSYGKRLAISLVLVAGGLILQFLTGSFLSGVLLLLVGSVLLCVQGYHNRVESGRFSPGADWENVEIQRLHDLQELDRKMLRWNRSAMDMTNTLGLVTLGIVAAPTVYAVYYFLENGVAPYPPAMRILLFNALVLLGPHWITGTRRILRLPKMMVKVEALEALLNSVRREIDEDRVTVMMLLRGETKIPEDVKLRVRFPDAPESFLGLYVQVVTNDVKGTSYPYVYVVLVAKQGYGLEALTGGIATPKGVVKEYTLENDVEILVIRQQTTKNSGYHTNSTVAAMIFSTGLSMAEAATRLEQA
ncbi:hypothetical protein [Desulfobulbus alkaliphilus]|uniref:hypothetical protein n=1 Tax=Desulfobulbus alkaliphilus TaxID=869814 RepID=UPI001962F99E|nr:hypothetical protein [Desulfobulbus alkaliphilus]MBM9536224.1 hypothetical protein [Desulfobulbus alkaliphilus]